MFTALVSAAHMLKLEWYREDQHGPAQEWQVHEAFHILKNKYIKIYVHNVKKKKGMIKIVNTN